MYSGKTREGESGGEQLRVKHGEKDGMPSGEIRERAWEGMYPVLKRVLLKRI